MNEQTFGGFGAGGGGFTTSTPVPMGQGFTTSNVGSIFGNSAPQAPSTFGGFGQQSRGGAAGAQNSNRGRGRGNTNQTPQIPASRGRGGAFPQGGGQQFQQSQSNVAQGRGRGQGGPQRGGFRGGPHQNTPQSSTSQYHQGGAGGRGGGNFQQTQSQVSTNQQHQGFQQPHSQQHFGGQQQSRRGGRSVPASIRGPQGQQQMGNNLSMTQSVNTSMMDVEMDISANTTGNIRGRGKQQQSTNMAQNQRQNNRSFGQPQTQQSQSNISDRAFGQVPSSIRGGSTSNQSFSSHAPPQLQRNSSFGQLQKTQSDSSMRSFASDRGVSNQSKPPTPDPLPHQPRPTSTHHAMRQQQQPVVTAPSFQPQDHRSHAGSRSSQQQQQKPDHSSARRGSSTVDLKKPQLKTTKPVVASGASSRSDNNKKQTTQEKAGVRGGVKTTATAPNKRKKEEEEEEEEYQDDYDEEEEYWDEEGEDEMYGQEDAEDEVYEESVDNDKTVVPGGFTNQDIQMIYEFKKKVPQAAKLCSHFVSNTCSFGKDCRSDHNVQLKQAFLAFLATQKHHNDVATEKKPTPKPAITPPVPKPVRDSSQDTSDKEVLAEKNKPKQLREMLQSSDASDQQQEIPRAPQEQKKTEKNKLEEMKKTVKKTLGGSKPVVSQTVAENEKKEDVKSVAQKLPAAQPRPSQPSLLRIPSQGRSESGFHQSSTLTSDIIKKRMLSYIDFFNKAKASPQDYIIPNKAHCIGMCPDDEIKTRGEIEISSVNMFEMTENGENFHQLAVKSYQRSAADKIMNEKNNIRPPAILYKTLEYLRDCIVDLDRLADKKNPFSFRGQPSFTDIYSFFRDRAKSLSQDFVVIGEPENEYQIACLEQLTRFFISTIHDIYTKGEEMTPHIKIINQNLTILLNSYAEVKHLYPDERDEYRVRCLKNEAEFTAYHIINLANDDQELTSIINGLDIQSFRDTRAQNLIREAIKISLTVQVANTPLYFKIIKSQRLYPFACLMLQFINNTRRNLLEIINRGAHVESGVSFEFLMNNLLFDDPQDALTFIEACGFVTFKGNRIYSHNRITLHDKDQREKFLKWRQLGPLSFMDALLGSQSRGSIMNTPLLLSSGFSPITSKIPPSSTLSSQPQLPSLPPQPSLLIAPPKPLQQSETTKQDLTSPQDTASKLQADLLKKQKDQEQEAAALLKARQEAEDKRRKAEAAMIVAQAQAAAAAEQKRLQEEKERKRKQEEQEEMVVKIKIVERFRSMSRKMQMKEVIKTMIEFKNQYKPLLLPVLGKRKSSMALQENQINAEKYFDLLLQQVPSLQMERQISETFHDMQFKARVASLSDRPAKEQTSIQHLARDIFRSTKQEGLFKVKLFYHSANLEDTSSSSNNLTSLIELFKDENSTSKEESVIYKFKALEFSNEGLQSKFMGTNLIVIYSSIKSLQGDLQKVQEALAETPKYARFSVMWIVNRYIEKNQSQQAQKINETSLIQEKMSQSLRSEVISCLRICTVFSSQLNFHQSTSGNKRLNTSGSSKISTEVVKNIVFAFIKAELEEAIRGSKIYSKKKESIQHKQLKDAVLEQLAEVLPLLTNEKSEVLKYVKSLTNLKNVKESGIFRGVISNEIQVLNFLILLTKQALRPISETIKSTIQRICQQFRLTEFSSKTSKDLLRELDRMQVILNLKLFKYAQNCSIDDRIEQLQKQVDKKLSNFYDSKVIHQHVLNQLTATNLFDSTLPREPHLHNYLGAVFFKILLSPYFTNIRTDDSTIIFLPANHNKDNPPSLIHLDLSKHLSSLQDPSLLIPAAPIKQPPTQSINNFNPHSASSMTSSTLLKKRTHLDKLQEELKAEMSPLLISNKRREVQAKRTFEVTQCASKFDAGVREIVESQEQAEIEAKIKDEERRLLIENNNKESQISQKGKKRIKITDNNSNDISSHLDEFKEIERVLAEAAAGMKKMGKKSK